jgi:hypothetical protein
MAARGQAHEREVAHPAGAEEQGEVAGYLTLEQAGRRGKFSAPTGA